MIGLIVSLMSICLIAGGINFGHLVKVVSFGSLHYKVSIFSFVSVTFLVGRYFEITHTVFLKLLPLILLPYSLPCGDFTFPSSFSFYLLELFCKKELSLLFYLFFFLNPLTPLYLFHSFFDFLITFGIQYYFMLMSDMEQS